MRLTSQDLEVEVHPRHGAVITSIVPRWFPQNLLWSIPGRSPRDLGHDIGPSGPSSGARFDDEVLLGGWFPMFPAVGPSGTDQDVWMHGEAPRIAWTVAEERPDEVVLSAVTPASAHALRRSVAVRDATVAVSTTVTNMSPRTASVSMGEHPCFPRETFAGGAITIDAGEARTRSLADPIHASLPPGAVLSWPRTADGRDLSAIPVQADGRHDHVVLTPRTGTAVVTAPAVGLEVRLDWDKSLMPSVMLWEHFRPPGGRLGGDVLALEPSTSSWRTHEEARRAGELIRLAAGGSACFSLSLTVTRTP